MRNSPTLHCYSRKIHKNTFQVIYNTWVQRTVLVFKYASKNRSSRTYQATLSHIVMRLQNVVLNIWHLERRQT